MAKEKIVLAYSGGLDTSCIIPWLKENYDNAEIIAVCADVGQGKETEGLEEKALSTLLRFHIRARGCGFRSRGSQEAGQKTGREIRVKENSRKARTEARGRKRGSQEAGQKAQSGRGNRSRGCCRSRGSADGRGGERFARRIKYYGRRG